MHHEKREKIKSIITKLEFSQTMENNLFFQNPVFFHKSVFGVFPLYKEGMFLKKNVSKNACRQPVCLLCVSPCLLAAPLVDTGDVPSSRKKHMLE